MRMKLTHLLIAASVFVGLALLVQSQQVTINSSGVYSGTTASTLNT